MLTVTGLVLRSKSPVGRLSGAPGGPARYAIRADDPVLVSGAAVVLDGTTVRAVRLSDGRTHWDLTVREG